MMRWVLVPVVGLAAQAAFGAWLGVCRGDRIDGGGRNLGEMAAPTGARIAVVVAGAPLPGCGTLELPLAPASIVAARLISPALAASIASGFALQAGEGVGLASAEVVAPEAATKTTTPLTVGVNLLRDASPRAFGAEGRARVTQDEGRLVLACDAGAQAAGAVLQMPGIGLPRALAAALSATYDATGIFTLALSDRRRAASDDPLPLTTLAADARQSTAMLPPAELDPATVESVTLVCPLRAATLELTRLEFAPGVDRVRPPPRALWVWDPLAWRERPAALLDKAARAGADTLFVTVPVDAHTGDVADPRRLEAFAVAARAHGVSVWAVVGDPRAVIEHERTNMTKLAVAYHRYNGSVAVEARLAGIQYDIEPYLNPGYALDAPAWHEAYLATLRALRQAGGLPVDVAVPFWWHEQPTASGPLLERLAAIVDSVTVMDYRTDPAQIKRFAQPFLEWGSRHRRGVRIALESGPIPDEVLRHYRPAADGGIALVAIEAQDALVEFDRTRALPAVRGLQRLYRYSHATRIGGGTVSFAGRAEALRRLLPELEQLWSAWPAFAGAALHEFEP